MYHEKNFLLTSLYWLAIVVCLITTSCTENTETEPPQNTQPEVSENNPETDEELSQEETDEILNETDQQKSFPETIDLEMTLDTNQLVDGMVDYSNYKKTVLYEQTQDFPATYKGVDALLLKDNKLYFNWFERDESLMYTYTPYLKTFDINTKEVVTLYENDNIHEKIRAIGKVNETNYIIQSDVEVVNDQNQITDIRYVVKSFNSETKEVKILEDNSAAIHIIAVRFVQLGDEILYVSQSMIDNVPFIEFKKIENGEVKILKRLNANEGIILRGYRIERSLDSIYFFVENQGQFSTIFRYSNNTLTEYQLPYLVYDLTPFKDQLFIKFSDPKTIDKQEFLFQGIFDVNTEDLKVIDVINNRGEFENKYYYALGHSIPLSDSIIIGTVQKPTAIDMNSRSELSIQQLVDGQLNIQKIENNDNSFSIKAFYDGQDIIIFEDESIPENKLYIKISKYSE